MKRRNESAGWPMVVEPTKLPGGMLAKGRQGQKPHAGDFDPIGVRQKVLTGDAGSPVILWSGGGMVYLGAICRLESCPLPLGLASVALSFRRCSAQARCDSLPPHHGH